MVGTEAHAEPLLSVILPVRNGASTIGAQLEALSMQEAPFPWEVLVVDNGSTDDSAEGALAWRGVLPSLRVVDASTRPGVAHARNRGSSVARGRFLAFCDSDDVVWPTWVREMRLALEDYDIVGGRIDEEALNDERTRGVRTTGQQTGLPFSHGFLPYAVGANFAVRTEVLRAIGGWNEKYTHAGDDIEFCWRATLAGFRLGFAPNAVVSYRFRTDPAGVRHQFFSYGVAQVMLYDEFRDRGPIPARPAAWALKSWASLARRATIRPRDGAERLAWNVRFGYRLGHAVGSARLRTCYL